MRRGWYPRRPRVTPTRSAARDCHHSPADTFDKVLPTDLADTVTAVAGPLLVLADDPQPLRPAKVDAARPGALIAGNVPAPSAWSARARAARARPATQRVR